MVSPILKSISRYAAFSKKLILDRASFGITFCTVLVIALLTVEIELRETMS